MTAAVSGLRVVRKLEGLSDATIEYLAMREEFDPSFPWVDNDAVRDEEFTDEVVAQTVEFGIANEDGELLKEGITSLSVAEKAVAGAKVVLNVEVEGLEDEDADDDE